MDWIKGDILYGRKRSDAIHPIIFWDGHDDTFFIGAMLTHSPSGKGNISMSEEHFYSRDAADNEYEVFFDQTYLVEALLLKKLQWRPFRKVGQLTDAGIAFVDSQIGDSLPALWEEYVAQGGLMRDRDSRQ